MMEPSIDPLYYKIQKSAGMNRNHLIALGDLIDYRMRIAREMKHSSEKRYETLKELFEYVNESIKEHLAL